jgi:uncharacterized membrane protein YhaH (DUF805 family)
MKHYIKVLGQYADFSGRARRKEYWMFVLFNCISMIAATCIDFIVAEIVDAWEPVFVCRTMYFLAVLIPTLAVTVRRLHDTGRSGWWILLNLPFALCFILAAILRLEYLDEEFYWAIIGFLLVIGLAGGIWLFVLTLLNSRHGDNAYGNNPKTSPQKPTQQAKLKSTAISVLITSIVGINLPFLEFYMRDFYIGWFDYTMLFFPYLCLFVIGVLLFPRNAPTGLFVEAARRRVGVLMIIYAGMLVLFMMVKWFFSLFSLLDNPIYDIISLLLLLSLLFFAITLVTSNKHLRKTSSIILIVMAGISIVVNLMTSYLDMFVHSYMFEGTPFERTIQHLSTVPLQQISFILLACVFMPRKWAEASLSDGQQEETEQPSIPQQTYDEEELQLSNDYALLHIYRPGSVKGVIVSYNLHLGDKALFRVKNKSKTTVKILTAGQQTLWAKTEARKKLPIDIQFGNEYYVRCGIRFGVFVGRPKLELVDNQRGKTEFDKITV